MIISRASTFGAYHYFEFLSTQHPYYSPSTSVAIVVATTPYVYGMSEDAAEKV